MNIFTRFFALFSVLIIALSFACTVYAGIYTSASSAILIEAESGDVIFEQNADEKLPMASTTKIMTALIALENRTLDADVTVSPSAVGVEGSSVYLSANEKLTMGDLVYALMLESANDAAAAIAIEIGGSIEGFAELMNDRAQKLGCTNTHFANPHGLDDEEHYTTARELAMITRAALENKNFRVIASTERHTIPLDGGGVRLLINHNRLLRENDEVIGVKTGFTKKSGRCLVTAAERDGVTVIAVTLSDPNDWRDHTAMLNHGLKSYKHLTLASESSFTIAVPVSGGDSDFVTAVNASPVSLTVSNENIDLKLVTSLDHFYFAPIAKGEVIGKAEWFYPNGELAASVPLVAMDGIEKRESPTFFEKFKNIIIKLR